MKPLTFVGSTLADLKRFPEDACGEAGYQLDRVKDGLEPQMLETDALRGSRSSRDRIRDDAGAYRVFYVTNIGDEIYVLHAFTKKTQKTSLSDINIGKARYKTITNQ